SSEVLRSKAERLKVQLMSQGVPCAVVETVGQVGGGSMPLAEPVSFACALELKNLEETHRRLRASEPAVVGRINDGQLLLDVRCLSETDFDELATAVRNAC